MPKRKQTSSPPKEFCLVIAKTDKLANNQKISVLSRQCLERRIPEVEILKSEIQSWEKIRNQDKASVNWRFQTTDARKKFERLYPQI